MGMPASAPRVASIASRSWTRPAWYGDALRFTTSSAPPAAWVSTGPSGNHASSQIVTATRTPATTTSGPSSDTGSK